LQEQWTTEVDIHSSWSGDFYTILNGGEGGTAVSLTFVRMPLMRWLWLGGCLSGLGVVLTLCPTWGQKRSRQEPGRCSGDLAELAVELRAAA
jgi:cytochrome c biogenesis factor